PEPESPEPPISIAANPGNTRAKVVVASSAAALVSDRAYRECTTPPSIGVLREIAKNVLSIELSGR
ncbi:hypothetical protein, partial [Rhizobium sp. BR 314]|uniref:hypothetical protein n=1 Tax=Rhizobium sp. BR 314 TaxID=3040013 RepID=UPI0039BF71A4